MKKTAARWGAATLSAIILFTQVLFSPAWVQAAELDFWRSREIQRSSVLSGHLLSTPQPSFPFLKSSIADFAHFDSRPNKNAHLPTIVLIQDVHNNVEAQRNIGEILKRMNNVVVGVEAAQGPFNFDAYRSFPVPQSAKNIADYLIAQDAISGASWAGLSADAPLAFMTGVDDQVLYQSNIEAYQNAAPLQETAQKEVDARFAALAKESLTLSLASKKLFASLLAFHRGQNTIHDYLTDLNVSDFSAAPNVKRYNAALDLETRLNLAQAERERDRLMSLLVHRDPQRVAKLTGVAQMVAAGQLSPIELYRQLDVDQKQFPALHAYVRYLKEADSIDRGQLFVELSGLRKQAIEQTAGNKKEKTILDDTVLAMLSDKLVRFEMTPEEWAEYKTSHAHANVAFDAFYRLAEARNEKMAANILAALAAEKKKTGVLVAGGFHTAGLEPIFKQKGFDVLVVTPKFDVSSAGSGSDYLKTFLKERTPLTQLVRGEKVTLGDAAQQLGVSNPMPGRSTSGPLKNFVLLAAAFAASANLASAQTTQALQPIAPSVQVQIDNGSARVAWGNENWNVAPVAQWQAGGEHFPEVPQLGNVQAEKIDTAVKYGLIGAAVAAFLAFLASFRGPYNIDGALDLLQKNRFIDTGRAAKFLLKHKEGLSHNHYIRLMGILDGRSSNFPGWRTLGELFSTDLAQDKIAVIFSRRSLSTQALILRTMNNFNDWWALSGKAQKKFAAEMAKYAHVRKFLGFYSLRGNAARLAAGDVRAWSPAKWAAAAVLIGIPFFMGASTPESSPNYYVGFSAMSVLLMFAVAIINRQSIFSVMNALRKDYRYFKSSSFTSGVMGFDLRKNKSLKKIAQSDPADFNRPLTVHVDEGQLVLAAVDSQARLYSPWHDTCVSMDAFLLAGRKYVLHAHLYASVDAIAGVPNDEYAFGDLKKSIRLIRGLKLGGNRVVRMDLRLAVNRSMRGLPATINELEDALLIEAKKEAFDSDGNALPQLNIRFLSPVTWVDGEEYVNTYTSQKGVVYEFRRIAAKLLPGKTIRVERRGWSLVRAYNFRRNLPAKILFAVMPLLMGAQSNAPVGLYGWIVFGVFSIPLVLAMAASGNTPKTLQLQNKNGQMILVNSDAYKKALVKNGATQGTVSGAYVLDLGNGRTVPVNGLRIELVGDDVAVTNDLPAAPAAPAPQAAPDEFDIDRLMDTWTTERGDETDVPKTKAAIKPVATNDDSDLDLPPVASSAKKKTKIKPKLIPSTATEQAWYFLLSQIKSPHAQSIMETVQMEKDGGQKYATLHVLTNLYFQNHVREETIAAQAWLPTLFDQILKKDPKLSTDKKTMDDAWSFAQQMISEKKRIDQETAGGPSLKLLLPFIPFFLLWQTGAAAPGAVGLSSGWTMAIFAFSLFLPIAMALAGKPSEPNVTVTSDGYVLRDPNGIMMGKLTRIPADSTIGKLFNNGQPFPVSFAAPLNFGSVQIAVTTLVIQNRNGKLFITGASNDKTPVFNQFPPLPKVIALRVEREARGLIVLDDILERGISKLKVDNPQRVRFFSGKAMRGGKTRLQLGNIEGTVDVVVFQKESDGKIVITDVVPGTEPLPSAFFPPVTRPAAHAELTDDDALKFLLGDDAPSPTVLIDEDDTERPGSGPTLKSLLPFIIVPFLATQMGAAWPNTVASPVLPVLVLAVSLGLLAMAVQSGGNKTPVMTITMRNNQLWVSEAYRQATLKSFKDAATLDSYMKGVPQSFKFVGDLLIDGTKIPVTKIYLQYVAAEKPYAILVDAHRGDKSIFADEITPILLLAAQAVAEQTAITLSQPAPKQANGDPFDPMTWLNESSAPVEQVVEPEILHPHAKLTVKAATEQSLNYFITANHGDVGARMVFNEHNENKTAVSRIFLDSYDPEKKSKNQKQVWVTDFINRISAGEKMTSDEKTMGNLVEFARMVIEAHKNPPGNDGGSEISPTVAILLFTVTSGLAAYYSGVPLSKIMLAMTFAPFAMAAMRNRDNPGNDDEWLNTRAIIHNTLRGFLTSVKSRASLEEAIKMQGVKLKDQRVQDELAAIQEEFPEFAAIDNALKNPILDDAYRLVVRNFWRHVFHTDLINVNLPPAVMRAQGREHAQRLMLEADAQDGVNALKQDTLFQVVSQAIRFDHRDAYIRIPPRDLLIPMERNLDKNIFTVLEDDLPQRQTANRLINRLVQDEHFYPYLTRIAYMFLNRPSIYLTFTREVKDNIEDNPYLLRVDSHLGAKDIILHLQKDDNDRIVGFDRVTIQLDPRSTHHYAGFVREMFRLLVISDAIKKNSFTRAELAQFVNTPYTNWLTLARMYMAETKLNLLRNEQSATLSALNKAADWTAMTEGMHEWMRTTFPNLYKTIRGDIAVLPGNAQAAAMGIATIEISETGVSSELKPPKPSEHAKKVVPPSEYNRGGWLRGWDKFFTVLIAGGIFFSLGANGGNPLLTGMTLLIGVAVAFIVAVVVEKMTTPTRDVVSLPLSTYALQEWRNERPSLVVTKTLAVYNVAEIDSLLSEALRDGNSTRINVLRERLENIAVRISLANHGRGAVHLVGAKRLSDLQELMQRAGAKSKTISSDGVSFASDKIGDPMGILLANKNAFTKVRIYALTDSYWVFDKKAYGVLSGEELGQLIIEMMNWDQRASVDVTRAVLGALASLRAA